MSTAAPYAPLPVKVLLDVERTITYDRVAEYHMSKLPFPSRPNDLLDEGKSFAALVQWVWACLSVRDRLDFPQPELLVPLILPEKIPDLAQAFLKTFQAVQPPKAGEADPNVKGSKNGPSPASSSN